MGRTGSQKIKNALIFAVPGVLIFILVVMIPFIYGFYLTFTDWNGVSDTKNFIGFANYAETFKDLDFWTSMALTLKYVFWSVILVNGIGFILAYLLTNGIKGQNFLRTGFFTPNLVGGVVLGFI